MLPSRPKPDLSLLGLGLSALATAGFAYGALTPLPPLPGPPGSDKLAHLLAFAAIALPTALLSRHNLVWLLPVALGFGGAVELIQPLVGRGREAMDFLFDGLGLLAGTGAGLTLQRLVSRRG